MKLYSSKILASILDLTERRIRQLRDCGVLSENRPGYYDLLPSIQAYIRYLHSMSAQNAEEYNAEKSRLVRAKRLSQELDLDVKRGELYPAAEVEQAVSAMFIRFKSRILALPAKLSPSLCETHDPNETRRILSDALREALEELSDFKTALEVETADENIEENS